MKRSIVYCAGCRLVAFAIVLLILSFVSVKVQARQLGGIITDDNIPLLSHSTAGVISYATSQSEVIRGDRSIGPFESSATNLAAEPMTCYSLTLSHVGNGSDPIASPIQSTGCNIGEYVADESITLSGAIADAGWEISGWNGTINDTRILDNNTVSMPANVHEAKVIYIESSGSPVILLGPPTGYETSDHTPNFDWNDVTGAEVYNIQISPREDFSILPINHFVNPSWFAPGVAMINQSYWWRVRVRVAGEWSSWSDSARMITIIGAPGQPAPVAIGPDDGASTTNRQPTFDWTDVVTAARYRIQMSYTPDFKVLIVNQLASGSEFTPGINLTAGTYYWRVQAMGGGDVSWFTVKRSLTIE